MKFQRKYKDYLDRKKFYQSKENEKKQYLQLLLQTVLFFALALVMSACGQKNQVGYTETIEVKIPSYLSSETKEPDVKIKNNANLVEALLQYKEALKSCNADKNKIRDF